MKKTAQPRPAADAPIQSVAFVSLGCPKNLVDSERMLGLLAEDGLAITPDAAEADAIIINTCGFLEASKTESLGEIRDALKLKEQGKVKRVIVAGCLVQRHKTKLLDEVPGVDRLVGVFDREHIVEAVRGKANPRADHGHYLGKYHDLTNELANAHGLPSVGLEKQTKTSRLPVFEDDRARLRLTPRHYAYLRISEGCNQGCGFCTIPSIRGPMRSKPIEQVMTEARELAADGAVELNLIGQDTTSYGEDIGGADLSALLRTLDRDLPRDVQWLRLMYAYPSTFSDDMIKALADSGRFVKYIDMPLQHISDRMLTLMKRRVTRHQIDTLLDKLRKWIPGMAIRTTLIAGSPTETQSEHDELVRWVKEREFDHLGVFPYSPEPGTPMGRMTDQLPAKVRQEWVEEIMLAQQDVVFARNAKRVGETVELLIDRPAGRDLEDGYVARTQGQAPDIDSCVFLSSPKPLSPGEIVSAKIEDYQNYDLIAAIPQQKRKSLKVVSK